MWQVDWKRKSSRSMCCKEWFKDNYVYQGKDTVVKMTTCSDSGWVVELYIPWSKLLA